MIVRVLLVALVLSGTAEHGLAQGVAVGSRVRVISQETAGQALIGQVVALEPGVVVVVGEDGPSRVRVPVVPSTSIEVSRGKKSQAARGALIGTAFGAMPGLLITFGDYNSDKGNPAAVSLVGAAAGAGIGALIGLAIKSETWGPVEVPVVSAGIAPISRGAAVSFTVAWGRGSRER
jgi:hypothetical protein